MTPKEKAKDLFDKFLVAYDNEPIAIKSALIAVDELIKQEISLLGLSEKYESTWWNWVKEEIEKI